MGRGERVADAARGRGEHGRGPGLSRALGTPDTDFAAHVVRFMTEPSSRTYIINYSAGRELCRGYVDGDPAQFRRLLPSRSASAT